MDQTDEEIAMKVQLGDKELFGQLVLRYEPKMVRYAKKFIAGGDDIRDLVQDVFIKAYTNIQSFDPARRFSSWLYRVAHNEFINTIKKNSRRPFSIFDTDLIFPHPTSDETADKDANWKDLKKALDKNLQELDPKYREPLVLRYFEEMDYQEIAEIMRIPVSTVGVRIKRARDILKKKYEKYE